MPPDGPDRDDDPESQRSILPLGPVNDDAAFATEIKVFRDTPYNNATQMHIWSDGTREKMTISLVNGNEVRGWYANRGDSVVLQWPLVIGRSDKVVLNEDNTVRGGAPHDPAFFFGHNAVQLQQLVDTNCFHFGKIVVSCGDAIAYKKYHELRRYATYCGDEFKSWSTWEDHAYNVTAHLVSLDIQHKTITLHSVHPNGPDLEALPIGKFFSEFSLSKQLTAMTLRNGLPGVDVEPLPMANSTFTVVKALLKFRRLHLKAQERKFAPGGLGYNRVLLSDTALSMKRARPPE